MVTPIATWSCDCGYKQDFDPGEFDECPSCRIQKLHVETDPAKMIEHGTSDEIPTVTTTE